MSEDDEVTYEYTALAVEQQPGAPPMYLARVAAHELLMWADVPNAKAEYMAGYQRVYNQERAEEIAEFLGSDPKNIVPGAIIVTAAPEAVEINSQDGGVAKITVRVMERAYSERLRAVYESFKGRLGSSEQEPATGESAGAEAAAESLEEAEALEEYVEDADEVEPDAGPPRSYIAALTAELQVAIEDPEQLEPARRDAIRSYVESVSKPGLIIDGQHRVFGAKNVADHNVFLPIVLLPGLNPAEQVFHFYVLNNKARPLTPVELRRTVSTSLSDAEIDDLWERFKQAGVDPEAARWTYKANTDSESPFRGLIDFGLGGDGFIKENVAYQLMSRFLRMGRKYKSLYKDVPKWNKDLDDRLPTFYAFWSAIHDRYEGAWNDAAAARGGQIFYKASMLVLQEYLLDQFVQLMNVRRIDGKPSPFADPDDLRSIVHALLSDLPPAFFTQEWQVKQMDTTVGRKEFRDQLEKVIQSQGRNMGNMRLFRRQ
jgi:hypothetical protein